MSNNPTILEILKEQEEWNSLSDEEQIRRREIQLGINQPKTHKQRKNKRKPQWFYYNKEEWIETRKKIFERDGKVCYICGGIATQIDHVLPKSKYPDLALNLDNLKPVCWPCNSKKAARVSP